MRTNLCIVPYVKKDAPPNQRTIIRIINRQWDAAQRDTHATVRTQPACLRLRQLPEPPAPQCSGKNGNIFKKMLWESCAARLARTKLDPTKKARGMCPRKTQSINPLWACHLVKLGTATSQHHSMVRPPPSFRALSVRSDHR